MTPFPFSARFTQSRTTLGFETEKNVLRSNFVGGTGGKREGLEIEREQEEGETLLLSFRFLLSICWYALYYNC